jgi:ribosomal protein S18 acetylase RimI-like enzyme
MSFEVKELNSKGEILQHLSVVKFLYPELTFEKYSEMLDQMLNANYGQVAVFEDKKCIAISGFWSGTKLWCGKYIELDNVVVDPEYRSKGIGKLMSDFLEKKAVEMKCTILVLDAYTTNFGAHRFYYNQGFGPKGFHFVKVLDENGLT